jgi:hypothetical protein
MKMQLLLGRHHCSITELVVLRGGDNRFLVGFLVVMRGELGKTDSTTLFLSGGEDIG